MIQQVDDFMVRECDGCGDTTGAPCSPPPPARKGSVMDTKKLRELAAKATPGPWKSELDKFEDYEIVATVADEKVELLACLDAVSVSAPYQEEDHREAWALAKQSQALRDAEFIAACSPSTIVALCDALDAADALADGEGDARHDRETRRARNRRGQGAKMSNHRERARAFFGSPTLPMDLDEQVRKSNAHEKAVQELAAAFAEVERETREATIEECAKVADEIDP